MRVLVVEDEEFLAGMIAEGLRRDAVAVDIAPDGRAALDRLRFGAYDVMILDRDLPGCTATRCADVSSACAC